MKKLFAVLALAGLMVSCSSKKKTEKTAGKDTTVTTTNGGDKTTTTTTTTNTNGVPTFSDPEVQKFANDYSAFIEEYLNGMKDPQKLAALGKEFTDWSGRAQQISMKLAANPEEAKKWADWALILSKKVQDATANMYK